MTTSQNKYLHKLLTATNLMSQKEVLVSSHTGGRTSSSAEMDNYEAQSLISTLKNIDTRSNIEHQNMKISDAQYERNLREKRRRTLIAMSYSINENVDFVKQWCEKYGVNDVKKKFNDYNSVQLRMLIEKFKKVTNHRINKSNGI